MRILKETELRKVKVLGSGAFGTVYKVRGGTKVQGGWSPRMHWCVAQGSVGEGSPELGVAVFSRAVIEAPTRGKGLECGTK